MAVRLDPRAERLVARLPRVTVYSALELLLLVLIAVQCARLFWATLVPLGPVGEWKALDLIQPVRVAAPSLGSYDPFFRGAAPAPQAAAQVTSLDVRLYGVTGNTATGGGSAIIGLPNGPQRSFAVGDEIMPGVTLTAIGFDNVTITRGGGAPERLYMDQTPAAGAGSAAGPGGYTPPLAYAPPPYTPPAQQAPMQTVTAPPAPPPPSSDTMTPGSRR